MRFVFVILAAGLPAVVAAGEEAVLLDGRRVEGALSRDAHGRLAFTPAGQNAPLAPDKIDHVRFDVRPGKPLFAAAVHRVTLADGQTLTGELLGLDGERLRLRTAWAGELAMPRGAVASVAQPPGWATVWVEDFEAEPKGWKLVGEPSFGVGESALGKRSLLLNAAGQSAEWSFPKPPDAGRLGVAFRLPEETAGLRWPVELDFRAADGSRKVRVEVGGYGPTYPVTAPGADASVAPVPRSPGWHRLEVEFATDALVITVDGDALWHDRRHGPGGTLIGVRLACETAAKAVPRGAVAFDDVSLAVPVTRLRHSVSDADQDEAWLMSGDGVFGKLLRADRGRITFQVGGEKPRELALDWGEVRGLFLRREGPPKAAEGEVVRLWLRTGTRGEPDEVEGTVRGLDEGTLTLSHPVLGEVKVHRDRVERLRWASAGRPK